MAAQRNATATWAGDLASGSGKVSLDDSGLLTDAPVSWADRTEPARSGRTSPEELIAGAHAACFCMALSAGLAKAGNPPKKLEVRATAAFEKQNGGFGISTITLHVRGWVDGLEQDAFDRAAQQAGQGCPVSKALKGNVDIRVEASLAKEGSTSSTAAGAN